MGPGEYAGVARVGSRFVRRDKTEEVVTDEVLMIQPAVFVVHPAFVKRGYGLTVNLGNYESARYDVSIEMPCYAEDVNECDKWCEGWISKRIQEETEAVRGHKSETTKKKDVF